MFGGQTWKDRSDLYCQISAFTLSLNVALKLKLRIKYLSAAKWQCATSLSPQDTSWAHTFGIIKKSMGENKLLLYLITKKKKSILCCIFPLLPVPCPFPCLTLSGDVSRLCLILITALTSFSCLLPTDPFSCFAAFLSPHFFIFYFFLHFLVLLCLAFLPSAKMGFMSPGLGHLQWLPELLTCIPFIVKRQEKAHVEHSSSALF